MVEREEDTLGGGAAGAETCGRVVGWLIAGDRVDGDVKLPDERVDVEVDVVAEAALRVLMLPVCASVRAVDDTERVDSGRGDSARPVVLRATLRASDAGLPDTVSRARTELIDCPFPPVGLARVDVATFG
jgi:hypothetical protein